MKKMFPLLWIACLASALLPACSKPAEPERKPKFYQSPMHPWITSDKPGNCTICGMQLVPVYDDKPASSASSLEVSAQTARVLGLDTAPVLREPLHKAVRVSGILEDDDTLHRVVAAFYDGRIEQVYVQQVGQKVQAGQPLASIYSPELLYVVREFQNASTRAKNDPVAINSRHRLIQYGLSPAQVEGLVAMPKDRYSIDILAPSDGTILVRNAYQGQYVKNGERLFEMGNLARLWFKAEIYERDLPFVRIGEKAVISTPAVPGRTFDGAVTFLDPNFDPQSRSTKIRIEVDNPLSGASGGYERLLPHRAYAEALVAAATPPVLTIPRSALIRDGRREVVYLQTAPGEYEMKSVQSGRSGEDRIEIHSGLKEGDVVVASGNLMLDAESQLRLGAALVPGKEKPLPDNWAGFLESMASISAALAADDAVAAGKIEIPALHETKEAPFAEAFLKAGKLPPLPKTSDLAQVRAGFYAWSTIAADLALELKRQGYEVPVRVFECPMTGNSFPGAPKHARWVQKGDKAFNPYLGMEMQDCGNEVQP
jgi:Cu(I)/Ag(I) efflux system membrane fusion protein